MISFLNLALTYLALRNHYKGRNIFANYHLHGIPFTYVKSAEQVLSLQDGFAGLDERGK
jgi:hypothetical protein